MEELEAQVQKHVKDFIKLLPNHVIKWEAALSGCSTAVKSIENKSEQLRCVENQIKTSVMPPNINDNDLVLQGNETLKQLILAALEEEFQTIKTMVENINKYNHDLKNRLQILEKSTLNLNWSSSSELIKGTPTQPPLSKILLGGLAFVNHFLNAARCITETFKTVDCLNEKSVMEFEKAFDVDLNHNDITKFLSLTQYILDPNSVS